MCHDVCIGKVFSWLVFATNERVAIFDIKLTMEHKGLWKSRQPWILSCFIALMLKWSYLERHIADLMLFCVYIAFNLNSVVSHLASTGYIDAKALEAQAREPVSGIWRMCVSALPQSQSARTLPWVIYIARRLQHGNRDHQTRWLAGYTLREKIVTYWKEVAKTHRLVADMWRG